MFSVVSDLILTYVPWCMQQYFVLQILNRTDFIFSISAGADRLILIKNMYPIGNIRQAIVPREPFWLATA